MDNNTQAAKKEIHIVFQVLNFLHSDHHLAQITTPAEHLLLINLASHKGEKGICPSLTLIAKELKLSRMTVIRSIQRWEELDIVQIQKNNGKKSYYFLNIPLPTSNIDATGNIRNTGNIGMTTPVTFTSSTGNIHDDIDITKEELSKNKKAFNMQNQKMHSFAESMNQMASEKKHIEKNNEYKKSPVADVLAQLTRQVGKTK